MERIKSPGAIFLLLMLLSGNVLAQIDTVKINKYYIKKCWNDSKSIIASPFRWDDKDWAKLGLFVVSEGALSLVDEPVKNLSQSIQNKPSTFISKYLLEDICGEHSYIIASGILTFGLISGKSKCISTALLALESYGLANIVTRASKTLIGRKRPDDWQNEGPYAFRGPFNGRSFPSGHATSSFAVASVIANQYRDSKWIPITAYSVAGLAGLSRIYDNKHWLTDVVAGAAIGTLVGNLVSRRTGNEQLTIVPFNGNGFRGIRIVYALN
jgi:membrane-associated phospholipid phosphatase